jgi:MFS family permease
MHDLTTIAGTVNTRRRWTTGGLLGLLIVVNYLDRGNLNIALPAIRHDWSLTNFQVGMILSAFQWTYAFANVPMGWAVDRFGPRRVIIAAGLAWTVSAAATGISTGLAGLVAVRAALGLAESPMFPAGIKVVDSWFPHREKAGAVALFEVAVQIGLAAAPILGALLVVRFGWRLMFVIIGALSIIPLLIWVRSYRQPEQDSALHPDELVLILSGRKQRVPKPPRLSEWRGLFTHVQTWAMIAGGVSFAGMQSFYAWLPIYLHQTRHFSLVKAGGSVSLLSLAAMIGIITGALLSDLAIRRGWEVLAARRLLVVAGSLLGAAAIAATAFLQGSGAMLAAIAVGSLAGGLAAASWWALVPAVAPNDRLVASLGALQNGGAFLGAAVAPLLVGWLLDHGYDFHTVLVVSAGFALLGAAIYGMALRRPILDAG